MNSKRTRKRYNKKTKILIIMVLTVGVIGLSIGFSAFSKNLDINSTATVNPDPSNFKILFSSSSTTVETNPISATYIVGEATGTTAKIDNSDPSHPKITDMKATFTGSGQAIAYYFYVINQGSYDAYLKNITFGQKTCTAKSGTSQALVNQVCEKIRIGIAMPVGSDVNKVNTSTTMQVSNHPLKKGKAENVQIYMDYYDPDAAVFADGDFEVTFGDITLTYSSSDS